MRGGRQQYELPSSHVHLVSDDNINWLQLELQLILPSLLLIAHFSIINLKSKICMLKPNLKKLDIMLIC